MSSTQIPVEIHVKNLGTADTGRARATWVGEVTNVPRVGDFIELGSSDEKYSVTSVTWQLPDPTNPGPVRVIVRAQ